MGAAHAQPVTPPLVLEAQALRSFVGDGVLPADFSSGSVATVCALLGLPEPPPRPRGAVGTFLRVVTINDVYKLANYPRTAAAIRMTKCLAEAMDYVCTSHLNGDFVSPCILTALDGGKGMVRALDHAGIDYACLGNHEMDLSYEVLGHRLADLKQCKVINSNVTTEPLGALPRKAVVQVGQRRVLMGGFLGEDKTIYPPAKTPSILPIIETAVKLWEEDTSENGGKEPDCFLPMTHQLTPLDREFASQLAKDHQGIAARTPVVLAGHDHEVFLDEAGRSLVVKVGMDAERIGFVDIFWDAAGKVQASATLLPATEFPPEPKCAKFCEKQDKFVHSMMDAPIAALPKPMTSKRVRFEESDMATFLLTLIRRGMHASGVEVVLLQGGAIRAGADYVAGPFTMGNLFQELAFDTAMATVELPGHIIADSVKATRDLPKPAPNFLHGDDEVKVDSSNVVTALAGKPCEPQRKYKVAVYQLLLTGLNVIEPLYSYVKDNMPIPTLEHCTPAKDIVITVLMRDMWRQLLGYEKWDANHDGKLTRAELSAGIQAAFSKVDKNSDGKIDMQELEALMEQSFGSKPSVALLKRMMGTLDQDHNGLIEKSDLWALAY